MTTIEMTANPNAHRLRRVSPIVGSQTVSLKASVPAIEATPGRFQGPKISQIVNAVATKFNPRPPKISLTPPNVLSAPANAAHNAPPIIPARIASAMINDGEVDVSCNRRTIQVVAIPPIMI